MRSAGVHCAKPSNVFHSDVDTHFFRRSAIHGRSSLHAALRGLPRQRNFSKRATIPDLKTVVVQQRSDNDLFAAIGRGEGHKEYPHGFLSRGLTAAQVKNLINYIRSMSTVAPSKK
jgi:hypothetical protein